MTPQNQAEQKANHIATDILLVGKRKEVMDNLALLIQKADALDWLEKNDYSLYADSEQPMRFQLGIQEDGVIISIHESVSSLLSAINQVRKEQEESDADMGSIEHDERGDN